MNNYHYVRKLIAFRPDCYAETDDVLDDLEYPHKLNCRDGQVKCYDPQDDDLVEFKKVWY